MYRTIKVAKTKALISFAFTAKLICVFVFAYAKRWFSHDAAHIKQHTYSETLEPRHEKTCVLHSAKTKPLSAFVFASHKVPSIDFLKSSMFCDCTAWFVSDLFENTEDIFAHD